MHGLLLEASQPDSFQKWILLAAGALTVIYAVLRPLKRRKDPLARSSGGTLASQRAVEKQMTELLVELEQMARQMTAQLETRAAKLDALIREADEKIAALRGMTGAQPQPGFQHSPMQLLSEPVPFEPLPHASVSLASDSRHAQIYELSDQGCSPRVIAQKLGRPHGEIELILALRGRQSSAVSA